MLSFVPSLLQPFPFFDAREISSLCGVTIHCFLAVEAGLKGDISGARASTVDAALV